MDVEVNVDSLRKTKSNMLLKVDDIVENITEIRDKIEKSKDVYDTPSATKFRDSANNYIYEGMKYIDEMLIPMIENLDTIADTYQDTINNINNIM